MRGPLLAALLCLLPAPHQTLWEGSEPRPQGKTPLERPPLVWQMRPRGGAQLRRIQMRVNGTPIPTRYDNDTQSIVGEPSEPLPLGVLKATCEVWLSNDKGVDMEWSFTRVPAPPPAPAPDQAQQEAIAQVNRLRRAALLPDMQAQPALCLAAARHSRYLLANKLALTHEQTEGKPEFYGKDPDARAERAGFFESCYEVIAQAPQAALSIQNLLDAPYHRAALLQPGAFAAGVGIAGDRVTLLCAQSPIHEVVAYPADGQLDVPTEWHDSESPDPLRAYPEAPRVVGYPVTLHLYGITEKPDLREATLTGPDGQLVPCYVNTPSNDDELDDMLLLIPKQPLLPLSSYRATLVVKEAGGRELTRSWQFTTGKAPVTVPVAKPAPVVKQPPPPPAKKKKK
ncbi:CAP domain-containing protein [Armatimonas rosea]|uniref:SCP domain-containing protein n=1 Tax=Armatimonas rosea TaxID=685828 RepID=A0A7W9SXB7_ARMRO|nr:hypothetical protein [Armatimonas rosea]